MPMRITRPDNISSRSALDAGDHDTSAVIKRIKHLMTTTAIRVVPIASLTPNPRNTRKHPEKQIALLAKNIEKFGFHTPIIADENGMILCGHARVEAAKRIGLDEVLSQTFEGLSRHEKTALAVADNRIAELSEFDADILGKELASLFDTELDLDFDPSIIGFDTVEIDQLLTSSPPLPQRDPADSFDPPALTEPSVSRPGDLWQCGQHRLICGDALEESTYQAVMCGEAAQIAFTDPPYNVPNKGHVTSRPSVREFARAHGELSSEQFITFLKTTCAQISQHTVDGAAVYICMDWRHLSELTAAGSTVFGAPKNLIVWAKNNAGQGSFYRSQHELILPFVNGKKSPINNFGLGAKGRYRTNVWRYPGFNSFGRDRDSTLAMHPTVKPVALVVDALLDCSHRRGIVLDPFGGSGTTMIAAERTGRCARLVEIDSHYCDVIIRRWQTFSSRPAVLVSSGQTFDETAHSRAAREP